MGINRFLFLLFFWSGFFPLYAQSSYVDSVESLLKTPINDTVKVWALNELSREFLYGAPDKAISLANEALSLARQRKYKRGEAYSYRVLASISATQDQYLSYAENLQKGIRLFLELNDSIGLGNCYVTEAIVYDRQLKFDQSIDSYRKALTMFRNANMPDRIGVCFSNMGFVYYRMGRYEEAKSSLEESIAINESTNNTGILMGSYSNLLLVYSKLGNIPEVKKYFLRVTELHDQLKENSNTEAYVEALLELSTIYYAENNLPEQKRVLEMARMQAEKYNYLELMKQTYYKLAVYHLHAGDIKMAYRSLLDFNIADDSLTGQRIRNEAAIITSVINSAKLETDFENARDNITKQELVILQQERTLIVVGIVGVLFSILLIQLFLVNRNRRLMNKTMETHRIAIDAKNAELEKLNQTKDKFFSVVAHDLRSPLNSLLGFSSLLVKHADSMSKEEIQKMGSQLKDAVSNTLKMTENLIVWARSQMQEEQTKPETIEVEAVVSETFKVFQEVAIKKEIQFDKEKVEQTKVFVDKNHFHLIVRNLINNALKYTKTGGKIFVTARQQNGSTEITVTDTGLGMDEAMIEKLFSLDTAVSQLGTLGERGTGLGLVLCKDFVERNQGTLHVKSEKNVGSSFILTLPSSPSS